MSKKKKGLLPKVEVLILLVFFLSFIMWAASKCNATKETLQQQAAELINVEPEEDTSTSTTTAETPATTDTTIVVSTPTASPSNSSANTSNANLNFLYITIDGLKMRTSPDLKGEVITQFPLFEKVYFMDEITEYKDSINLGKEYAYEPWVKIKSKKGHIGWVYGAGVHYHKQKRVGAE